LQIVSSSVNHTQLSRHIFDILFGYSIAPQKLLGASFDRASVNLAAFEKLSHNYSVTLAIPCVSHSLDNTGKQLAKASPEVSKFMKRWRKIMSSAKARLAFLDQISNSKADEAKTLTDKLKPKSTSEIQTTTESNSTEPAASKNDDIVVVDDEPQEDADESEPFTLLTYCSTRWWSWYECLVQLASIWPEVKAFILDKDIKASDKSRKKLRMMIEDVLVYRKLLTQIAVVVPAGRPFAQCTYILEGDGPIVLQADVHLRRLKHAIATFQTSEAVTVIKHFAKDAFTYDADGECINPVEDELYQHALDVFQPAKDYFHELLEGDLSECCRFFRTARILSPVFAALHAITPQQISDLFQVPFLKEHEHLRRGMVSELPAYRAAVEELPTHTQDITWWKVYQETLPSWFTVLKMVLTIPTSSASSERVFSQLSCVMSKLNKSMLTDAREACVMMRYNQRASAETANTRRKVPHLEEVAASLLASN
jgi:hypothetical protein